MLIGLAPMGVPVASRCASTLSTWPCTIHETYTPPLPSGAIPVGVAPCLYASAGLYSYSPLEPKPATRDPSGLRASTEARCASPTPVEPSTKMWPSGAMTRSTSSPVDGTSAPRLALASAVSNAVSRVPSLARRTTAQPASAALMRDPAMTIDPSLWIATARACAVPSPPGGTMLIRPDVLKVESSEPEAPATSSCVDALGTPLACSVSCVGPSVAAAVAVNASVALVAPAAIVNVALPASPVAAAASGAPASPASDAPRRARPRQGRPRAEAP